jgi:hypothetical protein
MPETLQKLQPDGDLQCYFFEPSSIAALSATSATGYTVSGTWRQQFDWAVIEWNRDNVFEHPAFRNLPDGDLSGLTLSYEETRENCIPLNSDLYATVAWPTLRIWANNGSGEQIYFIPLANYATPVAGSYQSATVQFTLGGTVTAGDYVGIAFLSEHYPCLMNSGDTLDHAIQYIASEINGSSPTMSASSSGATITITYVGAGLPPLASSTTGANGNIIGAYTYVSGSQTEQWDAPSRLFSGGTSPSRWQITLPFASLVDPVLGPVPANAIRKLRWTYSAALQPGAFVRSEFQVVVSNWTVTGSGRGYSIAGPGSQRIEDDSNQVQYTGTWTSAGGNFSGGTISSSSVPQSSVSCTYTSSQNHSLYLGTRLIDPGTLISIVVDAGSPFTVNLNVPGEDVLIRSLLGQLGSGTHTVTVTHDGDVGTYFYFDFFEIAILATTLPTETIETKLAAATDWDTEHSLALAPERTAWIIDTLGFQGRVNHYVGALWFYELNCVGQQYASATVTFSGSPDPNLITQIILGTTGQPASTDTTIEHLNLIGDTTETLATAFALLLNGGYTAVWAQASGSQLTIYSRSMGTDGNAITIATSAATTNLTITTSGSTFSGGVDGNWYTDLQAMPRINRAARDWSQSYFQALNGYGYDATASFSMELGNGDPSAEAGIAQVYPDQTPALLPTPSLQTNFSPTSAAFWQQVYLDMAAVLAAAGLTPYLQFGEVQWWYFPNVSLVPGGVSGMPFYDAYTTSTFQTQFGRPMAVITSNTVDPTTIPQEAAFLPGLIGSFTAQIRGFVHATYPNCRFEVLYPPDVNAFPLTSVINYPTSDWTPANLNCLKTENFTYTTVDHNLDMALASMNSVNIYGFTPSERSHLVGVSDPSTAWLKEVRLAEANGFESVVLFALDQMCLVGYSLPLSRGLRRSTQLG